MHGVVLPFADGEYHFFVPWAACAEIEAKAGAGILAIYARMAGGDAHLNDIAETLRQGLLHGGGGTVDGKAVVTKGNVAEVDRLLRHYVTGPDAVMSIADAWRLAQPVLAGAIVGYPEAQKKTTADQDAEVTA